MSTDSPFEIKILKAGLFTSVQATPNFDFLDRGVPSSGPMDSHSAQRANKIVGNPKDAEVIEITLLGPKLLFKGDCIIGISGADLNPQLNEKEIDNDQPISVKKGDQLNFGKCESGMRTYLAIAGKIKKTDQYLTHRLKNGESIQLIPEKNPQTTKLPQKEFSKSILLETGPETSWLRDDEFNNLFTKSFKLTAESNRMAFIVKTGGMFIPDFEMISSGVIPGTVQLLPSGNLAILMRDCQTMGGYPRIGIVPEKGLNRLAQIKPGEEFVFVN